MDVILQRLAKIAKKTKQLEAHTQKLKQQQMLLEKELEENRGLLVGWNQKYAELNERYEAVKLAGGLNGSTDNGKLKDKIELYLKEIDNCLSIIGSQR